MVGYIFIFLMEINFMKFSFHSRAKKETFTINVSESDINILNIKRKYKSLRDIEPIKEFYKNIESYLDILNIKYIGYSVENKSINVFIDFQQWDNYMRRFIRESKLSDILNEGIIKL
jgi:hypothetical protein